VRQKHKEEMNMNRKIPRILTLLLVMFFAFTGCKKIAPPVLKEIGPAKITAAQGFNVQPNGQSALWCKTENATKTTVIIWGDRMLLTTFGSPKELTALVPQELYAKPGQFTIYLLDRGTGLKSNSMVIAVK
jgi:hypothetical protein